MRQSFLSAALVLFFGVSVARADDPAPTPPPPAPLDWAVGAGIGTSGVISLGSLSAGSSTASSLAPAPALQVGLERRLGGGFWLLFQLRGTMSTRVQPGTETLAADLMTTTTQSSEGSTAFGDIGIGLRQRFRLSPHVFASWFAVVSGSVLSSNSHIIDTTSVQGGAQAETTVAHSETGIGANAGFSVDVVLIENLTLRLGTTVVDFVYRGTSDSNTFQQGSVNHSSPVATGWAFDGGLALAPSLMLEAMF